ncbi:MAG TPA: bifunctional (p)ppGpp synthetase/guanosine-3',5'-bis(diphosphate) 3'-pyrophosphohydrolase, partial [Desulfobulbaceae bacterium]|nr:bifunctional (p)ppGpp synthetase/guanosine-3',5'-bis(diphosphate) 3'-pyrophosphohydrolase [Desulfobulbaceae bacterium]
MLNRAYVFSMKVHGTQKRASGDPYFSHPLEVAGILTNMKMDCDTIVTALLHDTIEDTIATHDQIEELFGEDIAKMVDGVTKMSEITYSSESAKQAENFRKFLLAMSHDIRVLLVKLADRLHNMRTLKYIKKPEKRLRIARETLDIYAPLAERIGMQEVKEELEALAFPHVYPDAYVSILKRLEQIHVNTGGIKDFVVEELELLMTEAGIEAEVFGREKRLYSIWRKMTYRHVSLDDQADILAFRIIVDDAETCYRVLGMVHGKWQAIPGLIKDYISMPKPNGYQSLHTA